MTVSVIIPAYNAASTIAETLDSLCAQTHHDWEAIVVDDGSTDGTGDIARRYAERDGRIRVLAQSNRGESAARNAGLADARCEWLLFLDSDDWIAPAHLERLTAEPAANPHLDAVHCRSVRVACDGTLVDDGYTPPAGDLFPTLARRAAFPVHACIVRRGIVDALGGFDETLRTSPDWDLWQRVARAGAQFGAVGEVLAYYRMRPGSASLDGRQLLADGLRVLRRGHAADPRVVDPHPAYVEGMPVDGVDGQQFYLLAWCGGLVIGSGGDPCPLVELIEGTGCPTLDAAAIARCLFEAAPLARCQASHAWEAMWPLLRPPVEAFLTGVEERSTTPDLARRSLGHLQKQILRHSRAWHEAAREFDAQEAVLAERERSLRRQQDAMAGQNARIASLEETIARQERTLAEHQHALGVRQEEIDRLTGTLAGLKCDWHALSESAAEIDCAARQLQQQLERSQQHAEALAASVAALQGVADARRRAIAALAGSVWMRVGVFLRLIDRVRDETADPPCGGLAPAPAPESGGGR